eukprot:15463259-Alexandrium_andersonii.AAC.1
MLAFCPAPFSPKAMRIRCQEHKGHAACGSVARPSVPQRSSGLLSCRMDCKLSVSERRWSGLRCDVG